MELIHQRLGPYPGKLVSLVLILYTVLLFSLPVAAGENSNESASYDRIQAVTVALNELDFDKAVLLLNEIKDSAHPSVLLLRAFCHEMGIGQAIDSNRAFQLASRAAEMEDWEAAQFLAWQSITGNTGEPNLLMAEDWRRKISKWRKRDAHPPVLPTQIMVSAKEGYVPRYELVTPWIQKKALEMDPVAQFNLYKILMDGRSTMPNVNRAMSWLHKSAEGGYPEAASMMAFYYEHGFILQKNEAMQAKYLQTAAKAGDPEAQLKLGMLLIDPAEISRDVQRGLKLLESAASQGNADASYLVAEQYHLGVNVKSDLAKAYLYYSKAADLGDAFSMYHKGNFLLYGWGVPRDEVKANEAYAAACESGSADAAISLARNHLAGRGVELNAEKGKYYAEKAVELGDNAGFIILGKSYSGSHQADIDAENSFEKYSTAASKGDPQSQFIMGELLFSGKGVERNLTEALGWYRLAADNGHRKARFNVLKMEGLGWGTQADPEKLVEYYRQILLAYDGNLADQAEDVLDELELVGWDPESGEFNLMEMLRSVESQDRQTIHEAILNYEVKKFRRRILSMLKEPPADPPSPGHTEKEWDAVIREKLSGRQKINQTYAPIPAESPAPHYPEVLRFLYIEDEVNLLMTIGKDGKIKEHSYVRQPLPQFKEAVEDVLPNWRFIPGSNGKQPVEVRIRLPIPFQIR